MLKCLWAHLLKLFVFCRKQRCSVIRFLSFLTHICFLVLRFFSRGGKSKPAPKKPATAAAKNKNTAAISSTLKMIVVLNKRNRPTIISDLFGGWRMTVGSAFGITTLPGTATHLNLLQALQTTKPYGISALYREGTASLLNSMVNNNFRY